MIQPAGLGGTPFELGHRVRQQLDAPRHVWIMVPAGKITEDTFQKLLGILEPGDTIVDGGNSNFRDSQRRHKAAKKERIAFVDVGVSGGIWKTVSGGVRWEPFFGQNVRNGVISVFNMENFLAGRKSTVFVNAPAGVLYAGDELVALGEGLRHRGEIHA